MNPDKVKLPIGSLSMETFVALSICPNFQATVLLEPNTNITVLQNTAIKTNFQLTPSTKVNPGYNSITGYTKSFIKSEIYNIYFEAPFPTIL